MHYSYTTEGNLYISEYYDWEWLFQLAKDFSLLELFNRTKKKECELIAASKQGFQSTETEMLLV